MHMKITLSKLLAIDHEANTTYIPEILHLLEGVIFKKRKILGWTWWLVPIISALWEAKTGRS